MQQHGRNTTPDLHEILRRAERDRAEFIRRWTDQTIARIKARFAHHAGAGAAAPKAGRTA